MVETRDSGESGSEKRMDKVSNLIVNALNPALLTFSSEFNNEMHCLDELNNFSFKDCASEALIIRQENRIGNILYIVILLKNVTESKDNLSSVGKFNIVTKL